MQGGLHCTPNQFGLSWWLCATSMLHITHSQDETACQQLLSLHWPAQRDSFCRLWQCSQKNLEQNAGDTKMNFLCQDAQVEGTPEDI